MLMNYQDYSITKVFNCPHCDSIDVKRIYEVPAAHFIGKDFTKSVSEE